MKKTQLRNIIRASIKENLSKPILKEQTSCPSFTAHIHAVGDQGMTTPNWEARFIGSAYQWNSCMLVTAWYNDHWYNNVWLANFGGMCPSWMPNCWIKAQAGNPNSWSCVKYLGTTTVNSTPHPTTGTCGCPPLAQQNITAVREGLGPLFNHPNNHYATYEDCIGISGVGSSVVGCTDPDAANSTTPNATHVGCPDANGSPDPNDLSCCEYEGCSDPTACNWYCQIKPQHCSAGQITVNFTDDGSCILPDGCTADQNAINYDPNAQCDDGSCEGCTDQNATHYRAACPNSLPSSCIYSPGCMDQYANNWNSTIADCNGDLGGNDMSCCDYDPTWDCVQIGDHPKFGTKCQERFNGQGQFLSLNDCSTSGCEPLGPDNIDKTTGIEAPPFEPEPDMPGKIAQPGELGTLDNRIMERFQKLANIKNTLND